MPVLKNIMCKIYQKEKIGVVGRTGAGKTSLTLALTRIIDISSGDLFINNTNIRTVSLRELRSKISVIPQEPFIFEGTLRDNIDPSSQYSDEEVNEVINKTNLDKSQTLKKGLYSYVTSHLMFSLNIVNAYY